MNTTTPQPVAVAEPPVRKGVRQPVQLSHLAGPDGLVRVCAWCWPDDLDDLYAQQPHLRGLPVTYTVCEGHLAEMKRDIQRKMEAEFEREKKHVEAARDAGDRTVF